MTSLRLISSLPPDLEALATRTIGALLQVHRELGSGMSESIYAAATRTELELHGLPFESEKSIPVRYKSRLLGHQRVDLIVDGRLIVEIKSIDSLQPLHTAQVVSYLRLTGLRLGLLSISTC